jgi:DNA-binding NarL/FixJ family response regulator
MSAGPIRLVLAGTDACLRERVRALAHAQLQLQLAGDVPSGDEAVAAVADLAPDVLLLDMEITGATACSVTRAVLTRRPQLGIVVWIEVFDSTELPDLKAAAMQRSGASGCIDSAADAQELAHALVCASLGKAFVSARLRRRALLRATLTPREHEVLTLLAAGWTTAHIARTIGIAPATVSSHTAGICQKVGLAGRAEVVAMGRDLGLGRDMDATTDLSAYYAASHHRCEAFARSDCARRR